MKSGWLVRLWSSFSAGGLLLGTLFFAFSLTPTLLPRTFLTQGVLSGCSLAAGYGIGVFGEWLWAYMELPPPKGRAMRIANVGALIICTIVAGVFLLEAAQWQNSIRELMGMPPVDTAHPLEVGLIALATFAVLVALARLFRLTDRFVSTRVNRFVPARVSRVIGVAVTIVLFWSVVSGVLFRAALHMADSSFQQFDALIEPETVQPTDPSRPAAAPPCSSGTSLDGPDGSSSLGAERRETCTPLRGGNARTCSRLCRSPAPPDTPEASAKLALEELKRVGGFERSVLIVVTPTGTGWIDPAAMDSVEYLHSGDVASVAHAILLSDELAVAACRAGLRRRCRTRPFQRSLRYWTPCRRKAVRNSICMA